MIAFLIFLNFMFNQILIVDWIIISLIFLFFNSIKELHHNDMTYIDSVSNNLKQFSDVCKLLKPPENNMYLREI